MTKKKNILLRSILFVIMLLAISHEGISASVADIQKAAKGGKKLNKYTKFLSLHEFGKYTLINDKRIIAYSSNFGNTNLYDQLNVEENSSWHLITDLVIADYDVNIYNGKPRNDSLINDRIKKSDIYSIIEKNPDINLVIKLNFDFDFDNQRQKPDFDKISENLTEELRKIFKKIDAPKLLWKEKEHPHKGVIIDFGIQTNKAADYLDKLKLSSTYAKTLMVYADNYNDEQLKSLNNKKYSKVSLILNLSTQVKQNNLIENIGHIKNILKNNDSLRKKTIIYAPMLTNGILMLPPHKTNDTIALTKIIEHYQALNTTDNQGFMIGPLGAFYTEEDEDKNIYKADFFLSNVLSGSSYATNRYGMVLYMLLFFFFTTPLAWVIAPNLPNYFLVRNRIYYDKNVFENANGQLSQNRKYRRKYLTVLGLLTFIWLLFAVILFTNWLKIGNINLSYHSGYFIWILLAFAVLNLVIPMLSASTKLVYKFYIKPIVNFIFFLKPKGLYQRIVKLQKIFTPSKKDKIYDAPQSKYSTLKKCMVSIVIFALLNVYGWQFEFPATTFSWIFYLIGFLIVAGFAYNIFHWRGKKLAVLLDDSYLETFPKDTQKYITTTYPQYGAKIKDEEES